jgi:molybdenum cofactor cytidylyltransferase
MTSRPAVIVLAAGKGSRFAGPDHKLSQELDGSTVLGTTLGNALATRYAVIVVTTAGLAELACRSVAARDVVVLPEVGAPGHPSLGMGYSIACGVGASPDASGWLILPGDMPRIQTSTLQSVARQLVHHPVAYAQYRGRRGHPVGFSSELYSELVSLSGDEGARRLTARYPAHGVELDDAGVLLDLDTEADLAVLRESRAKPTMVSSRRR